ncbi:hypothetical protein B0H14DRAFT_3170551 [Mycena olivaceomarginata]|nr:hypothetical protein B0H14DRAFT_3170551 [Mycena olivaceomarginata]
MALLDTGSYTITNVKFKNYAAFCDANLESNWNVTRLNNGNYTIKNYGFHRAATCKTRPKPSDNIMSGNRADQQWVIKATRIKGHFTISPTDAKDLLWSMRDCEMNTPLILAKTATDDKNHWVFETYSPSISQPPDPCLVPAPAPAGKDLRLNEENRQAQESSSMARRTVVEFVARVGRLITIASGTTKGQGRLVQDLQLELKSITDDFNRARLQGPPDQFLSSTDNTSSLANHNMVLTQMIADSTSIAVHDVLSSLRDVEARLKSLDTSAPMILTFNTETIEIGSISGGVGGAGGSGHTGGVGGEGEGPTLDIAHDVRWKSAAISGGTGGDGGVGIELGGNGGTGKGPVIRIDRKIPHDPPNPDSINHQSPYNQP